MKLVFIGDSLIEFFDWQRRFPAHEVWNLGRAGETVQELLARAEAVTRRVEHPDWLLVMSGINNVAMEDYGFLPAYAELLERFRAGYPKTLITVNSLLPVRLPWVAPDALTRLNEKLQETAVAKGTTFFDIHHAFLDDQGRADPHYLLPDGVHLSEHGYTHWSDLVAELLDG